MSTTSKQLNSKWLAFHRPKPLARLSLFCFPYAGSGPVLFQPWAQRLPDAIDVCAVQLPGHGKRLAESRFTSIGPLVEAVAEGLRPHLDRPFAFFGHSMGALVAFELALLLRRERREQPLHVFVSGCKAPQLPLTKPPFYNLPAAEFVEELRALNGTPPEVLEHPELMELMLPIIRDDFTVCQTYSYSSRPPLDCAITAFGGLQDPDVSQEEVSAWRDQTASKFSMWMFPGNHFFIQDAFPQVLEIISRLLKN
jgi:medium-chain acyl-[acyl-carrier-protein] hydrolase